MKKLKLIGYLVLLRQRVLKCSTSTAKNVMKKLREMGVVEEVKGKGKGKYTFIFDSNYVKKVNEVGTNHQYHKTSSCRNICWNL